MVLMIIIATIMVVINTIFIMTKNCFKKCSESLQGSKLGPAFMVMVVIIIMTVVVIIIVIIIIVTIISIVMTIFIMMIVLLRSAQDLCRAESRTRPPCTPLNLQSHIVDLFC